MHPRIVRSDVLWLHVGMSHLRDICFVKLDAQKAAITKALINQRLGKCMVWVAPQPWVGDLTIDEGVRTLD